MMTNVVNLLGYDNILDYQQKITGAISCYTEKFIKGDDSVESINVITDYFISNNKWHIDFFGNISQLKSQYNNYEMKARSKNIIFNFSNPELNREMKYVFHNKILCNEWSISYAIVTQSKYSKHLAQFMNDKYPKVTSLLDLDIEKTNFEWTDWVGNKGLKLIELNSALIKSTGKTYYKKTSVVSFFYNIYLFLSEVMDTREEWIKDTWNIRNLEHLGIKYDKTITVYTINFNVIENTCLKNGVKEYFKQRLISRHNFSWGTAVNYMTYLPGFLNFIVKLEPKWNTLKYLKRKDILKYLEWLNIYVKENLTQRNANPNSYKITALSNINRFLYDIQLREYDIAPLEDIRKLIYPEDKPKKYKKDADQIDYIPDFVLNQIFNNINNLYKDNISIVWIMYKTGLRISDVLGLTQDCLIKLNNKFWIETDIEKTYVKGHRIPIDDELANMLAVLIDNAKLNSNDDNNPEKFIFVRYTGKRKGSPYLRSHIQMNLNIFAREYSITDENGVIYHFKNHAFRHTYAVKLLNGGADILTVQELLAHASPEMTMRYAKLLDDTKRKAFDTAVKQGVFSFDIGGRLHEETNGEVPNDVLDMLWTNHKLNAIDTPYGTCLQRSKGKCTFAKQPPCLTCNGGNPCKDLGVGIFEGDIKKYEIHINSTKALIEQAKVFSRRDMAKENEELLDIYENIYNTISNGSIVYGKLERLIKKGDTND
jgi:integrase